MHKLALAYTFSLLVAAITSMSSCSSAEHTYDCAKICNRYKDCFNSSYDVTECTNRCRNHADSDTAYADQAESCQRCIEDRSCTGATFSCATECVDIVP